MVEMGIQESKWEYKKQRRHHINININITMISPKCLRQILIT